MKRRTILIGLGVFLLLLLLIQFVGFSEGFREGVETPLPIKISRGMGIPGTSTNGRLSCGSNKEKCAGLCYKRCNSYNKDGKSYVQIEPQCSNCYLE